ncbi:MAG: ABC transporter ATP-binding protein [Blastopirellula sp.]|nr:MAG: ABC transporter ATP-binding protein [Blastopirellula sp.]
MSILVNQPSEILNASGLSSGYGNIPILSDVSLTVADGEFVGILGHNGMGKTTLLRTLMGHIEATAGSVRFKGEDITSTAPEARAKLGLGYVPQGRQIFPNLSVWENLKFAALSSGDRDDRKLEEILEFFPRLKDLLTRQGGVLSGGEQQLLALARCLATDPNLILLDEPTEGIQPSIIEEIAETLGDIRRTRGVAFVLVEQNLEFIGQLSERILIMQKGRIIRELTSHDLTKIDLAHEFSGLE